MNFQWDPKVGPAAIVSVGGALAVLLAIGAAWGTLTTKMDHVLSANTQTDHAINKIQTENRSRDKEIATQSAQISGVQSTVNFIVPTLNRIEQRLEAALGQRQPNPPTAHP